MSRSFERARGRGSLRDPATFSRFLWGICGGDGAPAFDVAHWCNRPCRAQVQPRFSAFSISKAQVCSAFHLARRRSLQALARAGSRTTPYFLR
jgi:hypothetical protein